MSSSAFHQAFEPLDASRPELLGTAAVPWDSETFGIGIADLDIDINGDCPSTAPFFPWRRSTAAEIPSHDVRLVGTSVPTSALAHIDALQAAGFRYLDTTLRVTYPRFQGLCGRHRWRNFGLDARAMCPLCCQLSDLRSRTAAIMPIRT